MRTVLRIFRNDVKSIARRFFASAVILAISVLPALYAWVNIYANGNPYANTKGIKIAVASLDPGVDLEDGTHVNMAEEVFEELKESESIGWQFPGNVDKAIEGVRSGKYYAAIIFEEDFTYDMYNFEQALLAEDAPITYYVNQKKNAIAPKITDTAASTLQQTIKTKYLETVFGIIFDKTNDVSDDLAEGETVNRVISRLEDLRDTLKSYDSAISSFTANSRKVKSRLSATRKSLAATRKSAKTSAAEAKADLAQAKNSVKALSQALDAEKQLINNEISKLEEELKELYEGGLSEEEQEKLQKDAQETAEALKTDLDELLAMFPDTKNSDSTGITETVRNSVSGMITDTDSLKEALEGNLDIQTALNVLSTIKKLNETSLETSLDSLIATMETVLSQLEPMTSSVASMIGSIDPVLEGAGDTIDSLDDTLKQMQKVFRSAATRIDNIIDKVNAASEDERLELLIKLLGGDPELYAKFFSSLVDVEVDEVYSVASYGAAMTPFYTTLAIWVGGVILVAILKTHVDRKKYPFATETQAFFGRFLLFYVLGQVQAAITIAGDIFMLGCSPVHPWMLWFAASVTSFVFVLFIYALTLSFGDIGKAIVVIVMVLQIAGSSGSYPIEILPVIFGKVYKFFPFPYAINAMREAISGTYGNDYWLYLFYLLIYAAIGLAIGLLVRRPFIGMNDFVSEKVEETEVL